MYKTFKTVEELIEFVSDQANIKTLDSGEVTLKDWIEIGSALEKLKKDNKTSLEEKLKLKNQREALDKQIAELTEQLETTKTELAGLQDIHKGNDKEALQKLNKQLSETTRELNTAVAQKRELEKQVAEVPELKKQIETFQMASNRSRIVAEARKAAGQLKVPQHIIDDPDFERIVADDFTIDESGGIFSKGDSPQSVENYIAARQKEKPHWNPTSRGADIDPMSTAGGSGAFMGDATAVGALFTT